MPKRATKTSFKPGRSGNPGGLTSHEVAARRVLRLEMEGEKYREAFLAAYLEQLEAANPTILIDYANRIMGKPKEEVEVTGPDGGALQIVGGDHLTRDEVLAAIQATSDEKARPH